MGGNSSKSSVEQVNEFFNETTNSFMSENTQTVQASSVNLNSINLSDANIVGCGIDFNQSIDSETVATGQLSAQNIQDLTTQLANSSNAAIDNAATQQTGFLSPAIANSADARTNLKNNVTNIINNTMSSKTVQDIFASGRNTNASNINGLKLECKEFQSPETRVLKINQAIKSRIMAQGVANALTEALSQTIVDNTSSTDVTQSSTQKSGGIDDLVSAIFNGLNGIVGVGVLIVCIICCCLLILLFMFKG
jgi:hypothetical protein